MLWLVCGVAVSWRSPGMCCSAGARQQDGGEWVAVQGDACFHGGFHEQAGDLPRPPSLCWENSWARWGPVSGEGEWVSS